MMTHSSSMRRRRTLPWPLPAKPRRGGKLKPLSLRIDMLWTRTKSVTASPPVRLTGMDLDASRLRMITVANGASHTQYFDDRDELPLTLLLDGKSPVIGAGAEQVCRRTPHLVCSGFLGHLGQPRAWQGSRLKLTPETALAAVMQSLPLPEAYVLALPGYLSATQLKAVREACKRPPQATVSTAIAIVAHRAESILNAKLKAATASPEWVVPIRPAGSGPGVVAVIDADDCALQISIFEVATERVTRCSQATWPALNTRLWKERLLDAISDRCVRQCRRDPRDSAVAEQGLWDQLPAALDAAREGRAVTLIARADHWLQELSLTPADFDCFALNLLGSATEHLRSLLTDAMLPGPPRAVWLSPAAASLPGLAAALYDISPEGTDVAILPADAGAEAAAALQARLVQGPLSGETHWDAVLPIERPRTVKVNQPQPVVS